MTSRVRVAPGGDGQTPYLSLAELAPLVRPVVPVDPDATFTELVVRSFNKGTFYCRTVKGAGFMCQELYLIRKNDLVFSNFMAREGAVARPVRTTTGASATTVC